MAVAAGVGILGTGGVAVLHADAIAAVTGLDFVGAFSRDPGRVMRFVGPRGGRAYASREELLGDPAVEVVAVCTPADLHVPLALEALGAGKHVIVEKPVGRTVADIDALQGAAAKAGRICLPCHNYIHAPPLRRARELASQGALGRIASFWLIYNQLHDAEIGFPGLTMRDLCIHHAYAVLFFLGRPARVVAASGNVHFTDRRADDQVMIVCTMPDGAIANLWGSFAADDHTSDPWTVTYKLLGTKGGFTHSWNDAYAGEATQPGWDRPAYRDSFRHVYEHFAHGCLGAGAPPLSTLADARDALCIIEAAEQALAAGPVEVDYR